MFIGKNAICQEVKEYNFPTIYIGGSWGYYNSFVNNFERETNKEPIFGGNTAIRLFNTGINQSLYLSAQFFYFQTKSKGIELIKWKQRYRNIGLKYGILHNFIGRHNAIIWLSTGLADLKLSNSMINIYTIKTVESDKIIRQEIKEEIVTNWNSQSFFVEIAHAIPFEQNNSPNFGFMWGFKYDHGKDRNLNLGSFAINFGFYYSTWY